MAVDRRHVMMGGAAALLVIALWGLWPSLPDATTAPPARANVQTPGKLAGAAPSEPLAPVNLAALNSSREEPGAAARNPFRFQPKPPASGPPRPAATKPLPEVSRPQELPAGPPPAPPIPLKLIGVLERANGVKWAVLTDGKSGPMYGKDGDIIDGRYMIVKIGTESIEMTHADGRGRQVIRLTGQ